MASTSKKPATRGKRKGRSLAFPVEFRLRIVKLFLEEGYSARLLVEQFGISTHSVQRWVRAYRLHGEAGLEPKVLAGRISRVPAGSRQQAVAVEHTQGEFKSYLDRWSWKAAGTGSQALLAESAAHDLNHQPRRCLSGDTACRAYFGGARIPYSRHKRESLYRWIQDLAAEVSVRAGESVITPASWRIAARQWLVTNRLIKIERSEKVSPHFCSRSAHK